MSKIPVAKLPILGKRHWQSIFEFLYHLSLRGMNYGPGADPKTSGELFVLKYIKHKLSSDNPVLFDVGANVGEYTRLLSDFFGSSARIHSFEPSGDAYAKMRALVGERSGIILNQAGLGETPGAMTLYANNSGSALGSLYKRRLDHFDTTMEPKETVRIKSLDEYAQEHGLKEIDFLKIDVEGHELNVLKGAKNFLDGDKIKFIQFEFGGTMIDSRVFFQDFYYLLKDKYRLYRVLKNGLREIKNYREDLECFVCCNYLAEIKYL